jgi:hypothetical protein
MSDIDTAFCRTMLKSLRADMKRAKTKAPKDYWTYDFGRGHWEFQAPDFYWDGEAANAYDARYKGISAWLQQFDPQGFARLEALS